jgi:hypothetical protein
MTDAYQDHEMRETLLTAFPAPDGTERGDWERVQQLAANRPTLIGRVLASRRPRLRTGGRRRLTIAIAAGVLLFTAAGVALAAKAGLVEIRLPSGLNVFETPQKAAAMQRRQHVTTTDANTTITPPPPFVPDPIPAHMLPAGTPVPVAPAILQVTNDWIDSDGYTLVAVYAGFAGSATSPDANASVGRVVIVRQDLAKGTQSSTTVDAANTGALTITGAPEGASVEKSALTGDIELSSADGKSFVLHLATDTISGG